MELLVIGAFGLLGLVLFGALAMGALVVFPLAIGLTFIGWLIGGSTGAIVGLVIAGAIGALALRAN